jgi:hypothetical protein
MKGKPLAIFKGQAPGYHRVEQRLLVLGLTLCELEWVLFTDEDEFESQNLPNYVKNSNLTISDWTKMEEALDMLLSDVGIPRELIAESQDITGKGMGQPGTRYLFFTII